MRLLFVLWWLPAMALAQTPTQGLAALQSRKVLFAHQSVGDDVLAGLEALSREAQVPLRFLEGATAEAFAAPGLVHVHVGKNEDPLSKLDHFRQLLEGPAQAAEVAVLKLCYVDFTAGTDARTLFDAYVERVEALEAKRPGLAFVHVTAPLTTVQRGVRGWLKNTFGGGAAGERENMARHRYNALLRAKYAGVEPVFDLAAVEAGQGVGACRFTRDGQTWPCLRPELTRDGGHLNASGQREAARAFVGALAGARR